MKLRDWRVVYKLGFGLLGLSAVVTEVAILIERNRFQPANFFSYFTIQSNVIAVVALLLAVVFVAKPPRWLVVLRGAATLYILIVGIGFAALLSGLENIEFTAVPWDNLVLHYIMPAAVALDWFWDQPKRLPSFKAAVPWLLYPLAYLVYSLIRGAVTDWYPYPFLNPEKGALIPASVGLLILGLVLTKLLLWRPAKR